MSGAPTRAVWPSEESATGPPSVSPEMPLNVTVGVVDQVPSASS
jgi:hypothetical protein